MDVLAIGPSCGLGQLVRQLLELHVSELGRRLLHAASLALDGLVVTLGREHLHPFHHHLAALHERRDGACDRLPVNRDLRAAAFAITAEAAVTTSGTASAGATATYIAAATARRGAERRARIELSGRTVIHPLMHGGHRNVVAAPGNGWRCVHTRRRMWRSDGRLRHVRHEAARREPSPTLRHLLV